MLGLAIDPLAILAEFTPPLAIDQLGLNVLILALSAMLQATAGFGAALLGLPLLLWAGNSLVEAQVILLGAMLPQNLYACWRLRRSIDYREVAVPALIRLLALPLGVAGLVLLMNLPKQMIGQFVGGVILLAIGLQSFAGRRWESGRRWPWMLLTFGGSGVLQGLTGTGGPPMVLWVYGQRFTIDRARAFLFAIYVVGFFPRLACWPGILDQPSPRRADCAGKYSGGAAVGGRRSATGQPAGRSLAAATDLPEPGSHRRCIHRRALADQLAEHGRLHARLHHVPISRAARPIAAALASRRQDVLHATGDWTQARGRNSQGGRRGSQHRGRLNRGGRRRPGWRRQGARSA